MGRTLRKELFREIKGSFTRFLSIFVMVALGCMFLVGLRSAAPDMRKTSDEYFDGQNFMDIQVMSTLGLTQEDIDAFSQVEGVKTAEGGWSVDAILSLSDSDLVVKAISLSPSGINEPILTQGRLPEAENECVVEEKILEYHNISIGDTIMLAVGEDSDDPFVTQTFTITGVVESPLYISIERGTSSLGDGSVDAYVLLPESSFSADYYTICNVLAKGAKELDAYSEEYENLVDQVSQKLEQTAQQRGDLRYQTLVSDARKQVDEAQTELDEAQSDADTQITDAESELQEARATLDSGWTELEDGQKEYDQAVEDGTQQLEDSRSTLDEGWAALEDAKDQLNAAQAELDAQTASVQNQLSQAQAELSAAQQQITEQETALGEARTQMEELEQQTEAYGQALSQQEAQVEAAEAAGETVDQASLQFSRETYETMQAALSEAQSQVAAGEAALQEARMQLAQGQAEYEAQKAAAESQLAAAQAQINSSWGEYYSSRKELEQGENDYAQGQTDYETQIAEAQQKLADAQAELENGEADYSQGQNDLEQARQEAETKLSEGRQEIQDAQEQIDEIQPATIYVLDRSSNYGFVSYDQNAQRMDKLANMFPVIFYIVAALVCLTTMTRMVEEKRTEIGSIKAMGYGTGTIAVKFLCYGAIAAVGGGIVGIAIGTTLIPWVIFTSYGIMYTLPELHLELYWPLSLLSVGAGLFCTVGATLFAMLATAWETPAALMRPKAPKAGKRIFLEHIPFLWRRLRFSAKVCCRNLFRYKKRFIMTVAGIAGCTALLIAGLGLRSSIFSIIDIQYGQIYGYDLQVTLEDHAADSETMIEEIRQDENTDTMAAVYSRAMTASSSAGSQEGYITVTDDLEALSRQITFRDMDQGENVELTQDGVVISEKLAELLELSVGDTITIECGSKVQATVTGIVEHYVRHYIYLPAELYTKLFGEEYSPNELLITGKDRSDEALEQMAARLMEMDGVSGAANIGATARSFEDNMQAVNAAVSIIILSAAALALVVLYNLTNINITERIRELATIKVLGFYDREVAMYIYRENIILTVLGIALGQILGKYLCTYLIRTVELDTVMFGRQALLKNYMMSIVLSLAFALVVNLLMYFRMKKIDMVQSLKSVE